MSGQVKIALTLTWAVCLTLTRMEKPRAHTGLKRRLRKRGVNYQAIADSLTPPVSWHMVWAVLNGRKVSRRVLDAAKEKA